MVRSVYSLHTLILAFNDVSNKEAYHAHNSDHCFELLRAMMHCKLSQRWTIRLHLPSSDMNIRSE